MSNCAAESTGWSYRLRDRTGSVLYYYLESGCLSLLPPLYNTRARGNSLYRKTYPVVSSGTISGPYCLLLSQRQMPCTPCVLSSAHVRLASWASVWGGFCVAKCPDISPQDFCTSCFFPEYSSLYHTGLISLLSVTFPSLPNMSDLPLHSYLWVFTLAHHFH